jgi:diaminopimelate decarboxylase
VNHFVYRDGELFCEDVAVATIAAEQGTPLFIYSAATLTRHFEVFDRSFRDVDHLVCYSVKASSNISIIALFGRCGGGCDVVSGGELFRALRAGVPAERIVYSGVGKTDGEIAAALDAGILMFNVESAQELAVIDDIARRRGIRAPVAIRVNPDVDPGTHPYISTGMKKNKFGVPMDQALEQYRVARNMSHVEVVGVDCHIGSQLTSVAPFREALVRVKELVQTLRLAGDNIRYVDIGGGLGITYDAEAPPLPADYAAAVLSVIGDLGCTLIMEPGRVLTGNAGILVTRVIYTKPGAGKGFIIVDAGMNDLIRPSLYDAYQQILPVVKRDAAPTMTVDVVGPICESGDFLGRDRKLPAVKRGELLAVLSAGAYGFSMSSNYNSRPRAAEVLVHGDRYEVIRARETYESLVAGEQVATW